MGQVLQFKRPSPGLKEVDPPKSVQRGKGNTLCKEGHHLWRVVQEKQFDVRQGKLVTIYECERCRKRKVKTH